MATYRGLVNTLQIRDDGWVEVIIQAVQSGNSTEIFYIKDLDGDITMAHKRLGQLSLLRDAITRILPVEIDYNVDPAQGNLIMEVITRPRSSIDERVPSNTVSGVVIGVSTLELDPLPSSLKVVFTMAPGQSPEGDSSDNAAFQPITQTVWLPSDSPLFKLLKTSLKSKSQLQVKLKLLSDRIHEVELVGHIGSAARPIWICINQSACKKNADEHCDDTLTNTTLNQIKIDLCWKAQEYFNEEIWRSQVKSPTAYELKVDGRLPCCGQTREQCCCVEAQNNALKHFYLKGVHHVELVLHDQSALQPFAFDVY